MSYEDIPPSSGGSRFWGDAVANFAALPAGTVAGECRIVLDTDLIYEWNGATWQLVGNGSSGDVLAATVAGFTAGSVVFAAGGTLAEDNAAFFWDAASKRLGIGTTGPVVRLNVVEVGNSAGVDVEIGRFNTTGAGSPYLTVGSTSGGGYVLYEKNNGNIRFGTHSLAGYFARLSTSGALISSTNAGGLSEGFDGVLKLFPTNGGTKLLVLKGQSGQSANYLECQTNTGSIFAFINNAGAMGLNVAGLSGGEKLRVVADSVGIAGASAPTSAPDFDAAGAYSYDGTLYGVNIYAYQVVLGTTVYQAPTLGDQTYGINLGAVIDYGGTGYVANGDTITYRLYAYFDPGGGREMTINFVSVLVTDDGSMGLYDVDLAWNDAEVDGYYLVRDINGAGFNDFVDVGNVTAFVDNNTLWAAGFPGDPQTLALLFNVTWGWAAAAGAAGYLVVRPSDDSYRIEAGVSFLDDNTGWTAGPSPDVSNTSYPGQAYRADGSGEVTGPHTVRSLRNLGYSTSAAPPSTTELPVDKDYGIHVDSNTGFVYLAYNNAGSIKTVLLT